MHQSLCTITLEVQPQNLKALQECILELDRTVKKPPDKDVSDTDRSVNPYAKLAKEVPGLHFMSIMIFEDERYDPLVTIELNIDGDIGTFLPQIEVPVLQTYLRALIRCCKRPSNRKRQAMYDAITAPGSKLPLTPFLETCVLRPAAFHQGNRGLDRDLILQNDALFKDLQKELKAPRFSRPADASQLHQELRAALADKYPWLTSERASRWTTRERIQDYARLAGFLAIALFCLSIPGMILALLMPVWAAIAVSYLAAFLLWRRIAAISAQTANVSEKPPGVPDLPLAQRLAPAIRARVGVGVIGFLLAYIAALALLFSVLLVPFYDEFTTLYAASVRVLVTGLLTIPLSIIGLIAWVRWLEERDLVQENPKADPEKLRLIKARENEAEQNHMGSMVLVKPGLLRAVLLHAGLWGLGCLLRVTATDGYLASMRTIHFAHWAIAGSGGRLIFFSNFDGSWESYLDDFIEKAHQGLTLAWTNGIGFPYTRFLVNEGASKGRQFKAWARRSMAEGLFWFRAYQGLSVNQIERQYRIASGLCKTALSKEEARVWAWDL